MDKKSCNNCIHGGWAISGYVCTRHFMTDDMLKNKVCSYWELKEEEKEKTRYSSKLNSSFDLKPSNLMEPIIDIVHKDISYEMDEMVLRAVKEVGINVDRERLVKALTDARSFYDEGYAAAEKKYLHIIKEINGKEEE